MGGARVGHPGVQLGEPGGWLGQGGGQHCGDDQDTHDDDHYGGLLARQGYPGIYHPPCLVFPTSLE